MKNWKAFLILTFVCFAVYANSMNGAVISSDDILLMANRSDVTFLKSWYSIPSLLHLVSFKLGGVNVFWHHVVSISVHAVAVCVAFIFMQLFIGRKWALFGALLFAVHPINTEVVSWISGRSYSLLALFIMTILILYNSIMNKFNIWKYSLCLGMFAYCAFLSPGYSFTIPILLVIMDCHFKRRERGFIFMFPFLLLAIIGFFIGLPMLLDRASMCVGTDVLTYIYRYNWDFWWCNGIFSIIQNFKLLLWPIDLTFYHEILRINRLKCIEWLFFSILFLFVFMACFHNKKFFKSFMFSFKGIIIFLIPTYSFIRIASIIAERYLYFPAMLLCMALAAIFEEIELKNYRKISTTLLICLFLFFSIRTVIRNADYSDRVKFWNKTVSVSPTSFRGWNNLGNAVYSKGNKEEASKYFLKSLSINPWHFNAKDNLIKVSKELGVDIEKIFVVKQ